MGNMLLHALATCPLFDKDEEGEVNLYSVKNYLLTFGMFALFFVVIQGLKLLRRH